MVNIKVISRSPGDQHGYHRNFSKTEHRFGRAREYMRALKAAKLEHMHARPFVLSLDGHVETVTKVCKVRNKLPTIVSADWDGEIRCWDISQNILNWRVQGHKGRVMGLCTTNSNFSSNEFSNKDGINIVISTGIDKCIKLWRLAVPHAARRQWERDDGFEFASGLSGEPLHLSDNFNNNNNKQASYAQGDQLPLTTIHHWEPIHCIDSCWAPGSSMYACGASYVSLWDVNRAHELHKFTNALENSNHGDQVSCMAFNPSQYNVLGVGTQDRRITFFDTRSKSPMPYVTLLNWCNELQFNPIDPRIFVVASNDWCLYTFDMRYMYKALRTHRGHVDAVMSVDWSPTGKEFVSGSIDGHIRIWKASHNSKDGQKLGYSRELYKGKRMYNLQQVRWSWDNRYIISGSADGALRLWKSQRATPLHRLNARQKAHLHYCERLKEKYQHMPEIGTIWKFRNAKVPYRKPRNGVFYKKEKAEQKNLSKLKNKLQRNKYNKKGWQKIRGDRPWADKVVQNSGIVGEAFQ